MRSIQGICSIQETICCVVGLRELKMRLLLIDFPDQTGSHIKLVGKMLNDLIVKLSFVYLINANFRNAIFSPYFQQGVTRAILSFARKIPVIMLLLIAVYNGLDILRIALDKIIDVFTTLCTNQRRSTGRKSTRRIFFHKSYPSFF